MTLRGEQGGCQNAVSVGLEVFLRGRVMITPVKDGCSGDDDLMSEEGSLV